MDENSESPEVSAGWDMFHVKHSDDNGPLAVVQVGSILAAAGVRPTEAQIQALTCHGNKVLVANNTINLTAVSEPEAFVRLHIVDSLLPLGMLDGPMGETLDVGTGAGYPVIPWAILGTSVVLCEATKKKAVLLEKWLEELSLSVKVVPLRAEEYPRIDDARFDTVVARAVCALPSLLELASPLLRPRGRLIAMKGAPSRDEVDQAARAAGILGMAPMMMKRYALPQGGERRTLCVYRKIGDPRVVLPRRPGVAQRQPYGG